MGRVQEKTHNHTTKSAGDGDGGNPGDNQKPNSLEVDGLDGSVAESDTDSGTSNAH